MLPTWLQTSAYIAACLVLPVLWGWAVNWAFHRWEDRAANGKRAQGRTQSPEDSAFVDYQI
jgi:hypothetical protein